MRANGIVRQVLRDVEGEIHQARLNAVIAAVVAVIHGGQVGLAALGRAVAKRSCKHGIKRIDRLLGNRVLWQELEVVYKAIIRFTLRDEKRPVILLDWTESGKKQCSLTAAIPIQGRAITIWSTTVSETEQGARRVEHEFMQKLKELLPTECVPVLVGDAGFRGPWMRSVRAMGWDFLARVRGRTLVQRVDDSGWASWKTLWGLARNAPRTLGTYRLARSNSVEVELVAVDGRSQRTRQPSTKRRNKRANKAVKAQREPWFLATSLKMPASHIVSIYKRRMQIELMFRDLKSHRFGWSFEDARSRNSSRVAVQICLAALASLVCTLVGIAAEAARLHRAFQANTISNRRVLSLVRLGREVLQRPPKGFRVSKVLSLPNVGIP